MFAPLRWADDGTLAALRTTSTPPPKPLELFAHVLGAEHIWLARLREKPAQTTVWPALDLEGCDSLAQANHVGFVTLLADLDDVALDGEVSYVNSAGTGFRSTRLDILIHVALHGCYHRGQVALTLRQAGVEPRPTDYIAFVRGAPAATRRT